MRKIILFHHDSELGSAPAHKLYEAVHVSRKDGVEFPRSVRDYNISLDTKAIPSGVRVEERDI